MIFKVCTNKECNLVQHSEFNRCCWCKSDLKEYNGIFKSNRKG